MGYFDTGADTKQPPRESAGALRRFFLCSIPPAVGALAGRLTVALELLAQLLAAVQLQASTVLPLLRTISQTLTVQGLEMLQVKAIGRPPPVKFTYRIMQRLLPSCILEKNQCTMSLAGWLFGGILLSTMPTLDFCGCHLQCSHRKGMLCAEALVEGFRQYPAQRSAVLDDIMSAVLPNLPTGKCMQRAFLIGDEEQLRTQMVSALMLQLVQVPSDVLSTATTVYVVVPHPAGHPAGMGKLHNA